MKQLFNVREANSKKIVAGPFENKTLAKIARNELDPDAPLEQDTGKRSAKFKYVVTKGRDHRFYGLKHKNNKVSGNKKKKKVV